MKRVGSLRKMLVREESAHAESHAERHGSCHGVRLVWPAQMVDLWLGLKKACRKAGLNDVTWHTSRHTFASRLTRNGADLVTVKELAWPFVGVCDDALRSHETERKKTGRWVDRGEWRQIGDTAGFEEEKWLVTLSGSDWEIS
jgi:hypothetical protein